MAETKIEWTWLPRPDGTRREGYTFNPVIGCSKVHDGCRNCYAEAEFDKRRHTANWGPHGTRVVTSGDNWRKPLKWNRDAAAMNEQRLVFCASLADVFEDFQGPLQNHAGWRTVIQDCGDGIENIAHVDPSLTTAPSGTRWATMHDVRRQLFQLIDRTPNLIWLLLTKRPENIARMWADCSVEPNLQAHSDARSNVWLGTSISNQESANEQIPHLLACRHLSPVLFLSCEPLLGPIDLMQIRDARRFPDCAHFNVLHGLMVHEDDDSQYTEEPSIDWVIAGGESGLHARPMHPHWARSLRDQCLDADVPFFFKQWGEWSANEIDPQTATFPAALNDVRDQIEAVVEFCKVGKKAAGDRLDGVQWHQFPTVKGGGF